MITGKDKKAFIAMDIELRGARGLLQRIRSDLELIASDLKERGVDVTGDPYWRLFDDIGRCTARLENFVD